MKCSSKTSGWIWHESLPDSYGFYGPQNDNPIILITNNKEKIHGQINLAVTKKWRRFGAYAL